MTDTAEQIRPCRNCGFNLGNNPCCAQCGQRYVAGTLSFRQLLDDLYTHILEWDLPWLHTLKMLTLNPGQVSLDYVRGKRICYVNPVKYLFYVVGVLALLATFLQGMGGEYFSFFAGTLEDNLNFGGENLIPKPLQFLLNHSALLMLLYTPLVAVLFRAAFVKSARSLIEIFCFAFYLVGHVSLFLFVFPLVGELLAVLPFPLWIEGLLWFVAFLIFLYYITRASMVFFEAGLVHAFIAGLLLFVILFVLLRMVPVTLIVAYNRP